MTNMFLLFVQNNFIIDPAEEPFLRRVWDTRVGKRVRDMCFDIQEGVMSDYQWWLMEDHLRELWRY